MITNIKTIEHATATQMQHKYKTNAKQIKSNCKLLRCQPIKTGFPPRGGLKLDIVG